jgi:hypothetical protein
MYDYYYSNLFQIASKQDFTTWAPYALAGIQQTILISMLIFYYVRDKIRPPTPIEIVTESFFSPYPNNSINQGVTTDDYPLFPDVWFENNNNNNNNGFI